MLPLLILILSKLELNYGIWTCLCSMLFYHSNMLGMSGCFDYFVKFRNMSYTGFHEIDILVVMVQ